ncbi:MAG: hypothetical protein HUU35_12510, partial [Armatimonadetes bacterium]|nr:hypothetical protein [Armatimonadota bacterium]
RPAPPAQVRFDSLAGWTLNATGDATISVAASQKQLLWQPQNACFAYAGGTTDTTALLQPPRPIPIEGRFDAANLWMYGALDRAKDQPVAVSAVLEDADGNEVELDLGPVTSTYWGLQHGVLSPIATSEGRFPMKFVGLVLANCKVQGERWAWLDCLHFYQQDRRPERRFQRRDPIFPVGDDGLLPTPPAAATAKLAADGPRWRFVSESAGGRLELLLDPGQGCLNGVSARWGELVCRPLAGGGMQFGGDPVPGELVGARVEGDRLVSTWRDGRREWRATYQLRGRTLVIDVACAGGEATGLSVGQVAGLPAVKPIEVPYLTLARNSLSGAVACGGGLYVSVWPDVYHSDFSTIEQGVPRVSAQGLALLGGTSYLPLTDGRRNALRDRLLLTISPEFAETLPNVPNPPSPNLTALAPYMFVMSSSLSPNLWKTLKQHGLDHIIANDFARIFVTSYYEGFAGRWRPYPGLTTEQIQAYREQIRKLGYRFGMYQDVREYFPLNEFWDENKVALTQQGDLVDAWYGNQQTKPNMMPVLMEACGRRVAELYPPECVYLDVHTNLGPTAVDYEAGVELAGMGRGTVLGNGDSIAEARKWYGATISEGIFRWLYAGVCDMDYAQIRTADLAKPPFLPDFDLLKLHPLQHGTMMGYAPSTYLTADEIKTLDGSRGTAPGTPSFYKYVSGSLAYGHMALLGYGYIPPLSRFIQYYALMQGLQAEYLTDTVTEISWWDGARWLTTSEALPAEANSRAQLRVRYRRGLTLYVNHQASEPWSIEHAGRRYDLPPYGWLAEKPGEILAFSALLEGERVDYVRCPAYYYLNTGTVRRREGPLELSGAVLLKREGDYWRLIPCGHLGWWEWRPSEGLPEPSRDAWLKNVPADRGCSAITVDTAALGLGQGVAEPEEAAAVAVKAEQGRLVLQPSPSVTAWRLR